MSLRPALLPLLALSGCLIDTGLGPDLGKCAVYPDETYTYGQAGIGRCIAGPAGLAFHVVDGETWLGVTNSNPFYLYASGSLLEIDADALAAARGTITADQLASHALPMEPFVGGLSYVADGGTAVVASRYSAGSSFRRVDDRVWLVDVTQPTRPVYRDPRFVSVGADPYGMARDDAAGRVYVLNATDTSVSVLDVASDPPRPIDPAPASVLTEPVLEAQPGSVGHAELVGTILKDARIDRTETWTATWVEGTTRLWVPTPQDGDGDGLARWSTGGLGVVPSGFGIELDPADAGADHLEDPWIALAEDSLLAFVSDGGRVLLAQTDGDAGDWTFDGEPVLTGNTAESALVSGPSVLTVDETATMFFDGRATEGAPARIFRATSTDGIRFGASGGAVLVPPAGADSIEQPSALVDPFSGAVRVWASVRDGDHWSIALATASDDGLTFDGPEIVIDAPGRGAAAPFVSWFGGRFQMWLAIDDGATWAHASAWSYDGVTWSDPVVRVDAGVQTPMIVPGTPWTSATLGFELDGAWGQVTGTQDLPDADGGVLPGSLAVVDGEPTLYATILDGDDRPRLAALRRVGDAWVSVDDDLVPDGVGGNTTGASDPVVFEQDGTFHLVYAAHTGDATVMRRATSTDGLHFQATKGLVLPTPDAFASVQQAPHAVTRDADGLHLWYAGFDGGRWRIATLVSADGVTWAKETGALGTTAFGTGDPGTFDDSGVRDPMPVVDGDRLDLWYAGFDGTSWRIGVATRQPDGSFLRRVSPTADQAEPMLGTIDRSFATTSVQAPVAELQGDGRTRLWFAGSDGSAWRIGAALGTPDGMWPELRFPSPGDRFRFVTRRGEPGRSKIDLGQVVQGFTLPGAPGTTLREGPTSAVLDVPSGMLFVGSEDLGGVVVVDVRDDSTDTWEDVNYLDIETVLRFTSVAGLQGITAMAQAPDRTIYLSSREPDGVLVLDPTIVVDDDDKELLNGVSVGILAMHDNTDDDGNITFAAVGAAGLTVVPDQHLLLVPHLRDNSLSVFDLDLGAFGEEIRNLEDVGENPGIAAVAPDGTWAVIATFLGQQPSGNDASSLAVLDLDPTSPTYLQIRARVVNQ
jgi:DNA-binding beta-propeller fold protein YncE